MRKETETLLKVIGNHYEVDPRSGLTQLSVFIDAVKTGRDSYHHFGKRKFDKNSYRQAMIEIVPFLDQMSEHAFGRLMGIAEDLDFHLDAEIGKAIKDSCVLSDYYDEQVVKRAKFLQTFAGLNPALYARKEMEDERKVREQYPWSWIGATEFHYPDLSQAEIVAQIIKNPDLRTLEWRIPSFVHKSPIKYLNGVVESLRGNIPDSKLKAIEERIALSRSLKDKVVGQ